MKKILLILFFSFFFFSPLLWRAQWRKKIILWMILAIGGLAGLAGEALATHNRAGEITFKHLSGNTFEITVTTYTKETSAPADRCNIEIKYGDGSPIDTIERSNGPSCPSSTCGGCATCSHCGESLYPLDIKINHYIVNHTYTGPGIYIISIDDPNRDDGIINFPNSVNTSFYLESYLIFDAFGNYNSSPILDFPPIDKACANQLFEHNPGAHDPDGDSLFFSIVPSMGEGGTQIPQYSLPNEVPGCLSGTLTINSSTGLLKWNAPKCCLPVPPDEEEFNVAILIEEFRNGVKVGSVLRDMQITVLCNCNNHPPVITVQDPLCVYAGTVIDVPVIATDQDGDSVKLTATGEPLTLTNSPATFNQPVTGDSVVSSNFHWATNCNHVRTLPYYMTFRAEDDNPVVQLVDYKTLEIKIIAPPVTNDTAIALGNSINLNWNPSICPATGYKIYRRADSSGFTPGFCQTGLPPGTGYSLIADCESSTTYSDNNNGLGLVHGQKYCYVVVACLAGGAENVVSEEFCAELKDDVPVITNVSVFKTDAVNGADSIMWSSPKELDTVQFPRPYRYKIYRETSFSNADVWIGSTPSDSILAFTDTFFVDNNSNLNTEQNAYTYKIELYSDTYKVGFTQNASSILLQSAPTDNALQLSWEEHVPWTNSKYFVYKKNSSGVFEYLVTTITQSYKDTGLVNGSQYCYYVQSFGGYTAPLDTLLNNSQIHCDIPVDNVAPCPPDTLAVQGDCNLFQNTLTWNNPSAPGGCADDVVGYKIYYSPQLGERFTVIETINSSADTSFLNDNLVSIAGCYAIAAIDTFNNEGTLSDSVCVDNCPVYDLPNVFTPGSDGKNDFFHPFPYKFIASIDIQIFNRWGELVFESTDPNIMWDGRQRKSKKMCPAGVYFYVCQVHEIRLAGLKTRVLKGYVELLPENGGAGVPNN